MWSIIISIIIFILVFVNIIRVIIYGKNILKPDFERIDEMFLDKHGISTNWNTTVGKAIYYVLILGIFGILIVIAKSLFS